MKRRLYVETNFIIELVLEQDGHHDCSAILDRTADDLEVFIPNVALLEARATFDRRVRDLREQLRTVVTLEQSLRRTAQATAAQDVRRLVNSMTTEYAQKLERQWEGVMRRLQATVQSFNVSFEAAIRSESELESPDFMIARATLAHATATSLDAYELGFVSRDRAVRDWAENQFDWACFSSFEAARGWALRSAPGLP